MSIEISSNDLFEMAQNVCTSFLGIDVSTSSPEAAQVLEGTASLTACVLISGDWKGAVMVHVSEDLARNVAAGMFAMGTDEVSEAEVQDALGEVANMLGGNVKGTITGSCQLSLPTVAEGVNHRVILPRSKTVCAAYCAATTEPLVVQILERED
jgi:chemotaxis protein CheX